ncbi:peptidoglycan editing factor PgeF [Algiphilus sp.]|uniref:peptidoglycan editing factor PgeF n=1 Tax=Algiphilus sp. TaxID=1872431 RepID=UPI003B52116B
MADDPLLLWPAWPAPGNVRACMSTRLGGVSEGAYASLNLGLHSGDAPTRVQENRKRLMHAAAVPTEPRWLKQVHGTHVEAAHTLDAGATPEADGTWTDRAQVPCVVMAADCLPVLLAHRDGTAVAAVHAGWRGLAAGVLEAGLAALPGNARDYIAWLGARIGPQAFVVREDVRAAFQGQNDEAAFEALAGGQWRADLGRLAALRLRAQGVAVYDSGLCTASDPEHYFSHRRDGKCGRMAALIWRAH